MKAIVFVKVDAKDGRPTTEFPARHGPANPLPGIKQLWFEPGQPVRYFGLAPDDADLSAPGVLREIPADEWAQLTEARRAMRLTELADYRFEIEIGGLELPDGTRVLTDRESQAQLSSAYQSLLQPFVETIDWKAPSGWVTVTEAELRPIAQAVARHVQGCFTAERRVSELIEQAEGAQAMHAILIWDEFAQALEEIKGSLAA